MLIEIMYELSRRRCNNVTVTLRFPPNLVYQHSDSDRNSNLDQPSVTNTV